MLDYIRFIDLLNKDKIGNVYLFIGEESYLISKAVNMLVERLIPPDDRDIAVERLEYSEITPSQLVDKASILPLISQDKVIIVKGFNEGDGLDEEHPIKKSKTARLEPLLKYCEETYTLERHARSPSSSSCTYLIFCTEKISKNNALFKKLEKMERVVSFPRLTNNQLVVWIKKRLSEFKLDAREHIIRELISLTGNNLYILENEISKLDLYLGKRRNIVIEDFIEIVDQQNVETIFQLIDYMLNNNPLCSINLLDNLIKKKGEHPLKILGMIIWQFRMMLRVKLMASNKDLHFKETKNLPPFVIRKMQGIANSYDFQKFANIFELLIGIEKRLKLTSINTDLVLYYGVLNISLDNYNRSEF